MKNLEKQIKLLEKYEVTNYTIENGVITINGSLSLSSLTTADKEFLKGTTINGYLYLSSLTTVHKEFLKGTTINGYLSLNSLTTVHKEFLKGTTINGSLYLNSLTTVHKDFLKGTTINGYLDLSSLTDAKKEIVRANVRKLEVGYNSEQNYCYFDGTLSKVISVHKKGEYTIYQSPFEYVVQKGDWTAHGKTVKQAIQDLEYKVIAEQLRHDPILETTVITPQYYHIVTGSCNQGIESWINQNFDNNQRESVLESGITAKDLLPILREKNAYGLAQFEKLISW
jgi:hypothetical protein